ncbi:hypothetical protein WwSim0310, partial [Wolbachia endosymbiont of Drosophila simulans]
MYIGFVIILLTVAFLKISDFAFVRYPSLFNSLANSAIDFSSTYLSNICFTVFASFSFIINSLSFTSYPSGKVPPIHNPCSFDVAILFFTLSTIISLSSCAAPDSTVCTNFPIGVLLSNICVTATKLIRCLLKNDVTSMQSFVSLDNLSSVYTTTQSTSPTFTSSNNSFIAGLFKLLPENPPSSYFFANATHPSRLFIYFSHTTRCASKLLNFCSSPSSFDFLVYIAHLTSFSILSPYLSFQIGAVHYNSFPLFCRLLLIMTYKTLLYRLNPYLLPLPHASLPS